MITFARTIPHSPAIWGSMFQMLISQAIYSDIPSLLNCTLEHVMQIVECHMKACQPIGCSPTKILSYPIDLLFIYSTVSEMEFLKLAQDIDPSYYYNVGISLGFSHAQLKAILIENLKNFKDAFMDVFMKWNVKQQPPHSNKRQLLADKLQEIDLGGLSDGLLNGPPFPNSTGKQTTNSCYTRRHRKPFIKAKSIFTI